MNNKSDNFVFILSLFSFLCLKIRQTKAIEFDC